MYPITRPRAFLLVAMGALLHLTILNRLEVFHSRPDVLFSLVLFFGLFAPGRVAVEVGIFAGLLKDIFSSGWFGLNTLIMSLAAFLINRLAPRFYRESKFAQGFLAALFYAFSASAWYLFAFLGVGGEALVLPTYFDFLLRSIVPNGFYTCIVSLVICGKMMSWFEPSERLLL